MKNIRSILIIILALTVITTSAFAAWPWEKNAGGEKAQGATKAVSQQQGAAAVPQQPVETPKIVIPRVVVPKIVFEQPPTGQTSSTTTETLPGGGVATKNVSVGGRQVSEPPAISFGMAAGELISAKELDPNNIEVKVKTKEGKELVVIAPATLTVTKRAKITELNPGEKVLVHYMHNAEDKKDTALYISIGEMPGAQFNVPISQIPQPGEEKKR